MAAGDLIWNGFTICSLSAGDVYTRATVGEPAELDMIDLAFPNTAGRELRITGNQNSAETAQTIAYGQSTRGTSAIFKSSIANLESFLYGTSNSIQALRLSQSSQIGTLVDRDGTYTGMRMVSFRVLTPAQIIARAAGDRYMVLFEAVFQKYTV